MSDEPHAPAELIRRLPATFGPALNDQFRQWAILFPAEQRQLRSQVDWLSRLPRDQFDPLFAPLFDIEKRMALPPMDSGAAGMSVRSVGILARSPLYPQWRTEVAKVFGRIDDATAPSAGLQGLPRLLVCVLPPGSPPKEEPLWPDLSKDGSWLVLDRPFGETLPAFAAALAKRVCPAALDEVERTWVFESDTRLSGVSGANVLSWDALDPLRREFLRRHGEVEERVRGAPRLGEASRQGAVGAIVLERAAKIGDPGREALPSGGVQGLRMRV